MLVEGDAEEILIPILIKKAFGVSIDELGISIINIRSTGFKNVADLFHNERIRRRCSIVTDLDSAIETKDSGAEKKGQERQKDLLEYEKGNDWVKSFYAEHTFEVDFVTDGNEEEVKSLIPEIYTDPKTIKQAEEDLAHNDVDRYGKRVLTMANNVKKGWFAIMLGKHITFETYIPEYILDALVFTKGEFSKEVIVNIIKYRIHENKRTYGEKMTQKEINSAIDSFKKDELSNSDFAKLIKSKYDDSQLVDFLNKL